MQIKSNSTGSRQLKIMPNRWQMQTYQIKQYAAGNILTEEVSGQICSGFGIHQTNFGWHITHLKTGWATFISGTREGAEIIALYLIENYIDEFERLSIAGCRVENFKPLAERIEADEELWNLRRLYAVSQRQLNRRARERQPSMQIIS
jgi:hypothetical protein